MIDHLNDNAAAVTGLATIALLLVTGWYAWTTRALLIEAKQTRIINSEPRLVTYLRAHEVHSNIVQLCVANLSGAAATGVSASIFKTTDWPEPFDLDDSKVLRDLAFMRPHEVLKFDLGAGQELFRDGIPATFKAAISYSSLDGRKFSGERMLTVESMTDHANWQIHGLDDIARRLKDISDTLNSFTGFKRLKVDTYSSHDRKDERKEREEQRNRLRQQQQPVISTPPVDG